MKFLIRALSGLILTGLTVALIGLGIWRLQTASSETSPRPGQPVQERIYTVSVATLQAESVVPFITAFGQVQAWRMLEIRAAEAGPIVEISPNFRNGTSVSKNELLFRVESTQFDRRLNDANVTLIQARADRTEAQELLPLVQAEVKNTRRQLSLRRADLKRKIGLKGKGFVAQGSLDEARLAVNAAEQSLTTKRSAEIAARARIRSRELAVKRAKITVSNAEKSLQDTSYRAPFTGPLTQVSANLGKRLSPNEQLGVLIDPNSLEVSFTVTDSDFGRLLADDSSATLKPLKVTATLALGEQSVSLEGVLDRAASVTDLTSGGRRIYARLTPDQNAPIRPGDFVTVRVTESPLRRVASVPASAATNNGELLLLTESDRLEPHQARVLRHQDETLIVTDIPFGREYVSARQPFLAGGIKVRALRQGEKPELKPNGIELTAERREKLTAFIAARKQMPQQMRERILKALERPRVPNRMVERIESRMKKTD